MFAFSVAHVKVDPVTREPPVFQAVARPVKTRKSLRSLNTAELEDRDLLPKLGLADYLFSRIQCSLVSKIYWTIETCLVINN